MGKTLKRKFQLSPCPYRCLGRRSSPLSFGTYIYNASHYDCFHIISEVRWFSPSLPPSPRLTYSHGRAYIGSNDWSTLLASFIHSYIHLSIQPSIHPFIHLHLHRHQCWPSSSFGLFFTLLPRSFRTFGVVLYHSAQVGTSWHHFRLWQSPPPSLLVIRASLDPLFDRAETIFLFNSLNTQVDGSYAIRCKHSWFKIHFHVDPIQSCLSSSSSSSLFSCIFTLLSLSYSYSSHVLHINRSHIKVISSSMQQNYTRHDHNGERIVMCHV